MPVATLSGSTQLDVGNYQGISVRTSAALTAAIVYSDWIDVRMYEFLEWMVYLTARNTITRLDIQVQFSMEISPNETTDWAILQAEDIAATGISTLGDYILRKTISDVITLGVTSPTRGRWMRIGIFAGVGDPAGSACSIKVLRRRPTRL